MIGSLLGLAGGIGGGGTSQSPGGGGGYGNSSASATSSANSSTDVGPIYGGGVRLGPDVTFSPTEVYDQLHLTGTNDVNASTKAVGSISVAWVLAAGLIALIFVLAFHRN